MKGVQDKKAVSYFLPLKSSFFSIGFIAIVSCVHPPSENRQFNLFCVTRTYYIFHAIKSSASGNNVSIYACMYVCINHANGPVCHPSTLTASTAAAATAL